MTDRAAAQANFVAERQEEDPRAFESVCEEVLQDVLDALRQTNDLLALTGELFVGDSELFQILRNFCGPPISEEDLWTMVDHKFKRVPAGAEERTAETIRSVLDRVRFPWVYEGRPPTREEREKAVQSTVILVASRTMATSRRGESSRRQEGAVSSALEAAGFTLHEGGDIEFMDDLPRGTFCHEKKVGGAKCDVPVRLRDGRMLAIECKVSNGPKNGWKRVNREVGGKSVTWANGFGANLITAVVLAGVFDYSCLARAQDEQNVALFWEHDLRPLTDFISRAE